jgi:quercetin dioxygenase-like cupin family protein
MTAACRVIRLAIANAATIAIACSPTPPSSSAPTEPTATKADLPPPPKPHPLPHLRPQAVNAIECTGALERAVLERHVAALPKGAAAAHLAITVSASGDCRLPALPNVDAMLVAIAGDGHVRGIEETTWRKLGNWDAVHVPGLGVELTRRTVGIVALLAIAPTSGTLASAVVGEPWTTRPSPIARVELRTVDELAWGDGQFRAYLGFGAPDSPHLSLAVLRIEPGATIPTHEHAAETEVVTVVDGTGDARLADTTQPVAPGTTLVIPAKTPHGVRTTASPLLVVQSYAPAGPEQRFRKLAAEASNPANE